MNVHFVKTVKTHWRGKTYEWRIYEPTNIKKEKKNEVK